MTRQGKSLLFCMLIASLSVKTGAEFYCHGDICNWGTKNQFCSSVFKMCRNCADVVMDCGTARQPINCTSFCTSHLVETELSKLTDNNCFTPGTPANGFSDAIPSENGLTTIRTNISFNCEKGYHLIGSQMITCLGNNSWTGTPPFCLDRAYNIWKYMGIAVSGVSVITVLATCLLWRRNKRNEMPSEESPEVDSLAESGIESCITEQNETSPMLTADRVLAYGNLKMEDKGVGTETYQEQKALQDNLNSINPGDEESSKGEQHIQKDRNKVSNNHQHKDSAYVHITSLNVNVNHSQVNNNADNRNSETLSNLNTADEEKEERTCDKTPTEESQITTDAIPETSEKPSSRGTKSLPSRMPSNSPPKIDTKAMDRAFVPGSKQLEHTKSTVIGLGKRTFHKSDIG